MDAYRVGYRVRSYRKLKGYTQQELADKLGISVAVLGSLERGMREPEEKLMLLISETLGVSYEELCDIQSSSVSENRR